MKFMHVVLMLFLGNISHLIDTLYCIKKMDPLQHYLSCVKIVLLSVLLELPLY